MTGEQLKTWRTRMRLRAGEAAEALGVSRDTYRRMEGRLSLPKHIGLACAAISHGLPPAKG
ncbi:helix-turn-helix domain-containing protein [Caulobacter hibisci]